jgi:hypothetical protein
MTKTKNDVATPLDKAIRRAGLKPWPKLFQNLRSTRETELMKSFPIAVVCAWLGNSPKVALKHYHQVTDADFEAALKASNKAQHFAQQSTADRGGPKRPCKDTHPRKQGKNEKSPGNAGASNEPVGTRTRDLRIKSPLLYRLSYRLKTFSDNGLRRIAEAGFSTTTTKLPQNASFCYHPTSLSKL